MRDLPEGAKADNGLTPTDTEEAKMTINPAAAGLTLYRQLAAAVHADTLTRREALELANTTPDGQIAQIALDRVWKLDHEMGCGCDTPEAHVADYAVLPGDDLDEALSLELVRRVSER